MCAYAPRVVASEYGVAYLLAPPSHEERDSRVCLKKIVIQSACGVPETLEKTVLMRRIVTELLTNTLSVIYCQKNKGNARRRRKILRFIRIPPLLIAKIF